MAEIIYKNLGETSFQAIERFRNENPKYLNERLSFAGRLDPMAEGEMLILIGEDNDNRDHFLGLGKEYESEFLFGIATDSFDLMGKIQKINENTVIDEKIIEDWFKKHTGTFMQKFPPFSKRHVKGKAMFVWASEGRLDEIEIPEHEIDVYSIDIKEWGERNLGDIAKESISRIENVIGDFRQKDIIEGWKEYLDDKRIIPFVRISISCGTGTYIRQLAEDLGKDIGSGACCYSIKRTKIDDWKQ